MSVDARRHAPATTRNRDPILAVLREALPSSGMVLEIASGTGEHAVHFSRAFPLLDWQPSDPDPAALASIDAWRVAEGTPNLRAPVALDAADACWPVKQADALVCINMIHISPWQSTPGLMAGAGRLLAEGCPLVLYGPFRRADRVIEPGNDAFDQDLKLRNPKWGLRAVEDVRASARDHGLGFDRMVEMPADNLCLIFKKL